jgi:hypothetical protein
MNGDDIKTNVRCALRMGECWNLVSTSPAVNFSISGVEL